MKPFNTASACHSAGIDGRFLIVRTCCAIVTLLWSSVHAEAQCPATLDPTEAAICEQRVLTDKEQRLSQSYAHLLDKLSRVKDVGGRRHAETRELMVRAQSAWNEFRKNTCKLQAQVALLGNPNRGQLGYEEETTCLARMVDQRLQELEEFSSVLMDK